MRFLYTGSPAFNTPQNDPGNSLGGFVSSTVVPNDSPGNMFSDISYEGTLLRKSECRGYVLENSTGASVTSILFGYRLPPGSNFTLEVAFVTLDAAGQKMERLATAGSSPYIGTFVETLVTDSVDGSVSMGTMAAGAKLGFWLCRKLTGALAVPTFATLQEEIDFYKAVSTAGYNFSKKIQLILKYTTT